ncbi:hypothetical protein ACF068_12430 [Streptomyces sp. NPDC016309]|uniref:hypothetical protein n=1 Tax=Streptomyces sp. NPDC016309 TaxID=3364965 RepID=UPI0036FBDD1C
MEEDHEIRDRAVELAARRCRRCERTTTWRHPATLTGDVLSLAPYVADYIQTLEYNLSPSYATAPEGACTGLRSDAPPVARVSPR